MSHFVGGGIFQIGLNRTDLGCWRLSLRAIELKGVFRITKSINFTHLKLARSCLRSSDTIMGLCN